MKDKTSPEAIRMSSPDLDESDVQAVLEVVRSGQLALGPKSVEFERRMAEHVGVGHAVAVSSGTAALHLIVRALGIGPGDEVLVPSFTFAASVNAILYEGATPVFVDIDPDTYNLSPADLESKFSPRSRAVMGVDIFGHPVEWDEILPLARGRDLRVIDDACEALGAEYRGTPAGRFGDAAAFGFYPNKQITTGEGGMVVTDSPRLAGAIRSMRNQGRGEMGAWLEHERLGFNYRMDEMSAALGVSQLARLNSILTRRERVAHMYGERLNGISWIRTPQTRAHVRMSWFVYVVTLAAELDRDRMMSSMQERGIPVRAYFSPIHEQPYIRQLPSFQGVRLPVTESVARCTLALPFHNHLTEEEVDRVVGVLKEVATKHSARPSGASSGTAP